MKRNKYIRCFTITGRAVEHVSGPATWHPPARGGLAAVAGAALRGAPPPEPGPGPHQAPAVVQGGVDISVSELVVT